MDEELRKILVRLIEGQEALITGQNELRATQEGLISGQEELRTGQRGLIIGQNELRLGQEKLDKRLSKLEVKLETMDDRLKQMVEIQEAHYKEDQRQHKEMIKILSNGLNLKNK